MKRSFSLSRYLSDGAPHTSVLFSGSFLNSTAAEGYYVLVLLGLFPPLRAGQYRMALYIFFRGRRTERTGQVGVAQGNFRPSSSCAGSV